MPLILFYGYCREPVHKRKSTVFVGFNMIMEKRLWAVVFFGLGVGVLIILASGLSGIEFSPGQPFFLSAEEKIAPFENLAFKSWNLVGLWKVFGLVLLWVLFPLSAIYFIVSPDARKTIIRRAMTMGLTAYAFFLLMRRCSGFKPPTLFDSSLADSVLEGENLISANFSPEAAQWLEWFANLLFIAVLIFVIWLGIRWWSRRSSTLQDLSDEASQALIDLQSGADLKDTVLRCYVEMNRVLRQGKGISRGKAMTPREFEHELARCGFPELEVRQLTHLFELVRYGGAQLGKQEQNQALACLSAIVEASKGAG